MKLTKEILHKIIEEEMICERERVIIEREFKRIDTLHKKMFKEDSLNELSASGVGHFLLDIGGLIPGIGETADLANAALYAKEGEYLMAALSAISMIPGVGDVIGKGGKMAMAMGKGGKVAKMLKSQMPKIKKLLGGLAANPKFGKMANQMVKSVDDFVVKTLANPRSQEAIQGLQKLASTKPSQVVKTKGGMMSKAKSAAMKLQQKRSARGNIERTAQAIQGTEEPVE